LNTPDRSPIPEAEDVFSGATLAKYERLLAFYNLELARLNYNIDVLNYSLMELQGRVWSAPVSTYLRHTTDVLVRDSVLMVFSVLLDPRKDAATLGNIPVVFGKRAQHAYLDSLGPHASDDPYVTGAMDRVEALRHKLVAHRNRDSVLQEEADADFRIPLSDLRCLRDEIRRQLDLLPSGAARTGVDFLSVTCGADAGLRELIEGWTWRRDELYGAAD
jgi:hypothetical protein